MAATGITGPLLAGLLIDRQLYAGWTVTIAGLAAVGALAALMVLKREAKPMVAAMVPPTR